MITPWNWPLGTLSSKVAPALATGNTIVVKPSEYSAFSAKIVAELMHDAGVPAGVFNMVFGDGPTVGSALSRHPLVACISITGSVRAGAAVARDAADTIKRVHQELGGKSPNIILRSADLAKAVDEGVRSLMNNTGQSCSAPSRMIAPNAVMDQVKAIAAATVEQLQPGVPESNAFTGPVVNKNQFDRIQELIRKGIAEGATVVVGGPGKPDGLANGYYVKPTVFADTTPDMMIVREEIFGPVLVIQGYDTVEEAIQLALDTEYGLAAFVQGGDDLEEVRVVADRMQAGQVCINTVRHDFNAPFGGFRHSGNGREWGGDYGFDGFLEPKSLVGWKPTERAG
jgi:aldehyde dehydrogenase (NAD+)